MSRIPSKHTINGLTFKQKAFIDGVLETMNPTEAAARAYKIKKRTTATAIGHENLQKPYIRNALLKAMEEKGISEVMLVKEHKKIVTQDKNLPAKNTALDMMYRLRGDYAPEKHASINLTIKTEAEANQRLQELITQAHELTGEIGAD